VRWVIVAFVECASAGLMALSVAMNFSFRRTRLKSYFYGAAFGFAGVLKVAAPVVAAQSFANRQWGAGFVAAFLWVTFAVYSAVSAVASTNRNFTVDARKVQADQSELRRRREKLASQGSPRNERSIIRMQSDASSRSNFELQALSN
jgi:hypothetical protein